MASREAQEAGCGSYDAGETARREANRLHQNECATDLRKDPCTSGTSTAGTAGMLGASNGQMSFATGATRSAATQKIDYEGHLDPEVLAIYGDYMNRHRVNRRNGEIRASDNWQLGIPLPAYMKSLTRHFIDLWRAWRGKEVADPDSPSLQPFSLNDLLCAILFNTMGMLRELNAEGRNGGFVRYVTLEMRKDLEHGGNATAVLARDRQQEEKQRQEQVYVFANQIAALNDPDLSQLLEAVHRQRQVLKHAQPYRGEDVTFGGELRDKRSY